MLRFQHPVFPDESLQSYFSRLRHRLKLPNSKFRRYFFDGRDPLVGGHVPTKLEKYVEKFPVGYVPSLETLVRHHSAYPILAPFLPTKRHIVLTQYATGGADKRLGWIRWTLKPYISAVFCFCPQCVAQDRATVGEAYWHLHHHLAFVQSCAIHRCVLQQTSQLHTSSPSSGNNWSQKSSLITLEEMLQEPENTYTECPAPNEQDTATVFELLRLASLPKGEDVLQVILDELVKQGFVHNAGATKTYDYQNLLELIRLPDCYPPLLSGHPSKMYKKIHNTLGLQSLNTPLLLLLVSRLKIGISSLAR